MEQAGGSNPLWRWTADAAERRARQWLAGGPQPYYDMAVYGGGVLALTVAWHLAADGAKVALLAPELIGAEWPTRARAWLHRTGMAPSLEAFVGASSASYRAWGEAGAIGAGWRPSGHLALATSAEVARRWAVGNVGAGRAAVPVPLRELGVALAGVDPTPVVAAWHEPDGVEVELDELPWDLAAAAAGCGVDVFHRVSLEDVKVVAAGRRLAFAHVGDDGARASTTTVSHLVDASAELGMASAGGLGPLLVGSLERWLVTEPADDVLAHSLAIDDIDVGQASTGELVIRARSAPAEASWAPSAMASLAPAAATVVDCLPDLAARRVVRCGLRRSAVGADGLPLVGAVARGLWCCGGFAGDELAVAPAVGRLVATALVEGGAGPELAPFDPGRFVDVPDPASVRSALADEHASGEREVQA